MTIRASTDRTGTDDSAAPSVVSMNAAWYALIVFTLVTLFAALDRAVLILQADTIRKSLSLTDLQLGFMQGTSVAIMVALATYPLGWLADRFDRRAVLAGCVLFWSLSVVGAGMSHDYPHLLVFSGLVGAGEAGLVPVVNALIPDLFPEGRRQLANSIYALAATATGAIGLVLTGGLVGSVDSIRPHLPAFISELESWRIAFFLVATPAPVMMLLIASIRIGRRWKTTSRRPDVLAPPRNTVLAVPIGPFFRAHYRTMLCFYGGVMTMTFGFGAFGGWLAVIYQRIFHQTPQQMGAALGGIALIATALGFLISVYGLRFMAGKVGPHLNVRILWVSALAGGAVLSMMIFATNAKQMYAIQGVYIVLVTCSSMIGPTIMQSLVPGPIRARAVAIMSVLMAAAGAVAPPIVGLVSDQLKQLPNGLIVAAVLVAVPAFLLGAVLLYVCERGYFNTRCAAEAEEASLNVATAAT